MRYSNVWTPAQIQSVVNISTNVQQLEIIPEDSIQPYTPGAHIDVQVYVDGKPETRSYSLIGTYQRGAPYRIAVKRLANSRGGSKYMWSLREGSKLAISQPKNHFEPSYRHNSYLLIAGGIGITPIYGIALTLASRGINFRLLYAGSSRTDMPFVSELQQLGTRLSVHASDENQRLDLEAEITQIVPGTQMYVCGPLRMLDAVRTAWHKHGLPEVDLRYETFGTTGRYAPQAFSVSIPRLGQKIRVGADQSLLDALEAHNIEVMSDCRRGECGLCTVDILSHNGKVDHRDLFFSEDQKQENRKLCACVSRVVDGEIVIDTAYRGTLSRPMPQHS